ncbi:hypothetical protein Pmani_030576 [Petrolisthes manimaculis]|uniref:Major facilitator superfamily (MFS) profile domain-containing protein n=1 Tax=Petrolisthes manimaculis TaxID=1843537 RepID=A0AAE1TTB8_9EUCA|nr:hypothetical protein Pmani_030576 [Petrolisthes manimaculis]
MKGSSVAKEGDGGGGGGRVVVVGGGGVGVGGEDILVGGGGGGSVGGGGRGRIVVLGGGGEDNLVGEGGGRLFGDGGGGRVGVVGGGGQVGGEGEDKLIGGGSGGEDKLIGVGGGGRGGGGGGGGDNMKKDKSVNDFDNLLERVGGMGRYQILLITLVLIPVSFFTGYNDTSLEDSGEFSSCEMYRWIPDKHNNNNNAPHYVITNYTQECVNGWEYDDSQYTSTVATSFDWVCNKEHYSPLLLSTYMIGNTVGTLVLPVLADKVLGRRLVFYFSLVIHIIFTVVLPFVTTLPLHLILRFMAGLSFETYYLMPYIICLELTPVGYRALVVMLSFLAWTFGMCCVSLVAWLVPQWKFLALSTCVPCVLGFCYWRYIGAQNGATGLSSEEVQRAVNKLTKAQPKQVPLTHVFTYPNLRIRALLLFILCHCSYIVYGVLLMGVNVLPDSSVISHLILSLSELPSNFIGGAFVHYLGRRFSYIVTFIIIGALLVIAPFTRHNPWLLLFTLSLIKLFSTQSLYVIFVMVAEIFPTPVRTAGTGITVVFGMLGMVLVPQILHAQEYFGGNFKFYVMLGLTVVCLFVCLPLPETLGLPLPQTFQDSEDLGRGRPLTKWIHHWNHHHYPPYNNNNNNNSGSSPTASSLSQEPRIRSCQEGTSFLAKV